MDSITRKAMKPIAACTFAAITCLVVGLIIHSTIFLALTLTSASIGLGLWWGKEIATREEMRWWGIKRIGLKATLARLINKR